MIMNKSVHNRKKAVPSTVLEKLDIHMINRKRIKLDLYLLLYAELTKNSLKSNTNESIYKTDSQPQKIILLLPNRKGEREGQVRSMGLRDTNYCI